MNYLTTIKSVFMTLLFVGFSGISVAQQGPTEPAMKPGGMKAMHRMQHWQGRGHQPLLPGMTDEQKDQIKNIMLKTRKEVLPVENQIREKEAHLKTLSTSENVDMKAVDQTIDAIGSLKTQVAKKRAASRQEIRSLLTDEQRIVFDSRKGSFFSHQMRHHPHLNGKR